MTLKVFSKKAFSLSLALNVDIYIKRFFLCRREKAFSVLETVDTNVKIDERNKSMRFFGSNYDFKINGDRRRGIVENSLSLAIDSALRGSRFLSDVDRCSRRYGDTYELIVFRRTIMRTRRHAMIRAVERRRGNFRGARL